MRKGRNHRKQIFEFTFDAGTNLTNPKAIKAEIIQFYKSLIGSSTQTLSAVNKITMTKGANTYTFTTDSIM